MNLQLPRQITSDEVNAFQTDGVVLLKSLFDPDWIELLDAGLNVNLENPTSRARIWDRDEADRTMFWDSQAWLGIEEYQQFVHTSPAAEIAGELMKSQQINFFFDAVFVRSAGCQFATPWHQDEPYWSVDGYNTCTLWMPLVSVARENALAFVPGSHKAEAVYEHYNFGALNPDGKAVVDQSDFSEIAETALPDIDSDPEAHGVVSWDMQPGDCVAFNGRTLHGGGGGLDPDSDLRVFTTKWLGDDVYIKFRECGMDPDHSEIMTEHGMKPGDRPGTNIYPRVWSRT